MSNRIETLGDVTKCPFYVGKGQDWRRCPNKGKYQQFKGAGKDVPLVCANHKKMNDRLQENMGDVMSNIVRKLGKKI